MRTPAKVQSLRAHEMDAAKRAPARKAIWRGPSPCTLPASGRRPSNSCSARSPPTKPRPKSIAPWATFSSNSAISRRRPRATASWCRSSRSTPWAGSTWRSVWSGPARGKTRPRPSTRLHAGAGYVDAHLGLGVCHLRQEDPKSALFSFNRCLELDAGPRGRAVRQGRGAAVARSSGRGLEIYQKHPGAAIRIPKSRSPT